MKTLTLVTGLIVLLFSVIMGWQSYQLRYYTPLGPGPGFFGVWLAGIGMLLAVSILVSAYRRAPEPLPPEFWATRAGYARIGGVIGGLAFLALAMETLGYVIAAMLFLGSLIHLMGERRLWLNLAVTVLGSLGIYYLFVHLLHARLPRGLLGAWLPA